MKWLIAILVVAVGGWLVWSYVIKSPPRRACERMADLCGNTGGDAKSCDSYFAEIEKTGPGEAAKVATCINESQSCAQAVGCTAGGALKIGADAAKNFLDGLSKSLGK
jgi:hypothetical protein